MLQECIRYVQLLCENRPKKSEQTHTHTHTHTYANTQYLVHYWCCGPTLDMASLFLKFLDHTQRRITVGTTPLDE